jgi:predicted DNA binding CopG/RHH family protein
MIVRSSRIRFLEVWARKLPSRNPEEVRHAMEIFAQKRFGVSRRTARKYAREALKMLTQKGDFKPHEEKEAERSSKKVTFRMSESEYADLKDLAKKRGVKVSALIRYCIREMMKCEG